MHYVYVVVLLHSSGDKTPYVLFGIVISTFDKESYVCVFGSATPVCYVVILTQSPSERS